MLESARTEKPAAYASVGDVERTFEWLGQGREWGPLRVSLSPGTRLGPYEVAGAIGAGGMGEVYRARDSRLDRDVAIKVLPGAFAQDAERVARFGAKRRSSRRSTIRTSRRSTGSKRAKARSPSPWSSWTARTSLSGSRRGAIPVDEAIAIARQIAGGPRGRARARDRPPRPEAREREGHARRQGQGPRLRSGEGARRRRERRQRDRLGRPLALAHDDAPGTGAGMILGTAAYMSPEQARGRKVDKRADIWAFGALVFEMLTGKRLFEGETVSDTLAAVLRQDVDWSALPDATPASVRSAPAALSRARREAAAARHRRGAAGAGGAGARSRGGASRRAPAPRLRGAARSRRPRRSRSSPPPPRPRGIVAWTRLQPAPPRPVTRLSIALPPGQVLAGNGGPAISRDGRLIAYAARDASGAARLYVRALDRFEATLVPESEGAQQPFFSPDGSRVGFFARGKLMTASVAGGAPTAIADASAQPLGGTWGEDDTIVFAPALTTGLVRVPASGGAPAAAHDARRSRRRLRARPSAVPPRRALAALHDLGRGERGGPGARAPVPREEDVDPRRRPASGPRATPARAISLSRDRAACARRRSIPSIRAS